MKASQWMFVLGLVVMGPARAETTGNQFLQYIYGADGIAVEKLCWPNDDIWMLRGAGNPAGLAELATKKVLHGANEVVWERIQDGLCIFEVREGKVDSAYMLEQVYALHRQLALRFIYASLAQDRETLQQITTKAANVRFGHAKAPPGGDMDVYQGVVELIPVVRASQPAADRVSKGITYRVPLGSRGFSLKMVKKGSAWLIDTDSPVEVPLGFFFR